MLKRVNRGVAAALAAAAGVGVLGVQADPPDVLVDLAQPPGGGFVDAGPDVIVGNLYDIATWGTEAGLVAYSVGTISCNIGDTPLLWIAGTNEHPVIGQSLFRYKNGRFEQLGQSWLKHGFTALQQTECGPCRAHPNGTALGVGCSDPYSAGLNGSHTFNRLGPKYQVNPYSGVYPYPPAQPSITSNILSRRIQVPLDDVNPALNAGAVYFVEGQYVTQDDSRSGNQNNNSSFRRVEVRNSNPPYPLWFVTGHSTRRGQPAIMAWKEVDPGVRVETVDVPDDGLFYVASRATDLGNGRWRYSYCVQNLNSERAAAAFNVQFPSGTAVSAPFFRDVGYHSGEIQEGTDWARTLSAGAIDWSVVPNANPDVANALRWGTMFTFEFEADRGPDVHAVLTLTLHEPGTPGSMQAAGVGPGCFADCDKSTGVGVLDAFDFLCFQNEFAAATPYACDADISTGPGSCDIFDFLAFQNAYGQGCP